MDNHEIVSQYKMKLKDTKLDKAMNSNLYNCIQRKYDGHWTALQTFHSGVVDVISSGGEVRHQLHLREWSFGECIFLAEWMFGTTWGNNYKEDCGTEFVIFDCVKFEGKDATSLPYLQRIEYAKVATAYIPESSVPVIYPKSDASKFLEEDSFEGIVWRNSHGSFGSPIGRTKRTFDMDYVFMGCIEGSGRNEGRAGSIQGGLYVDGVLKEICKVGGLNDFQRDDMWINEDKYIGRVLQAEGKGLFVSGALRHPSFFRWRDDKTAEECVL